MNVFIYFLFQTNLGGQHNAYHGFFYVEEHPPPPPPHAYELQQGYHPQTHQMVAYPQGKVNSVQEAFNKFFAVHAFKFEILQTA